ncbi:hypothetical protein [Chlorobaculum parvum]|nr:hypothetical protein [Chlorobaculum parvum]
MDKQVPREWRRYEYFNPKIVLPKLRKIREEISITNTPDKIKALRTNKLKRERESWDAAIFCQLLSLTLKKDILFSREEHSDFDSIFTWNDGEVQSFAPIQLKELVPAYANPNANLQNIINSLSKYSGSDDLIVGIKINRRERIEFSDIDTDGLKIRELWMFGATTESQSHWSLLGEVMSGKVHQYEYELPYI